jgi:hypothetical protein
MHSQFRVSFPIKLGGRHSLSRLLRYAVSESRQGQLFCVASRSAYIMRVIRLCRTSFQRHGKDANGASPWCSVGMWMATKYTVPGGAVSASRLIPDADLRTRTKQCKEPYPVGIQQTIKPDERICPGEPHFLYNGLGTGGRSSMQRRPGVIANFHQPYWSNAPST